MDIRNVGNHGNIDRTGEHGKRAQPRADVLIPFVAKDDARISDTGRKTAASVDRLVDQARDDDGSRDSLVEAARQKLLSGELDSDAVFASTAQKLAGSGFLSV
ncbi:MAG: hypothetical protein ACI89X_002973 [Planctomycetota bacterium]|jgi:hypothetical protein